MTAGVNRRTGRVLTGLAHVKQSLHVIFTTPIGTRVMRRTFGSAVPSLLGKANLTPQVLLNFYVAVAIAVELWEPRFRVRQVGYPGADNSTDRLQQGQFGVQISGDYRPNALEGDFTVASSEIITF
jgi:phage baseplate assembly protein W